LFIQNRKQLIPNILLLSLVVTASLHAQEEYVRRLNGIPVIDGAGAITNIYSGGINNLEYQFVDIDGDDDFDILFLDSDKTYGWYENKGSSSSADFELSLTQIPGMVLSDWFYFVDIDNDSDVDLFTGNTDLISFSENIGSVTSPSFQLTQDTVYSNEGQPIFSEFGSNPLLADIDSDGDFDFFSGNSSGTVTFYENIGTPENFNLKFITNYWQDILIIGSLNSDQLHGASSLDFIDIDADNDLDLFWGDFFSNSLYQFNNKGDEVNADMQLISNIYPVNADSINTSGFNMPRFVDISNNGKYDLFVSVLFDPTVPQSLMYYSNEGTEQNPHHIKITENYLKTLDVRANSHPSFADIDNDGDEDLFIGSLNNPIGTIHFLENIGSKTNPEFQYLDSSYFNISDDLSIIPNLGDLDGDNDFDILVGLFDGKIDYYRNTGTPESANFVLQGKLTDNTGSVIDAGNNSSPFLFDVDGDSDLDLSIGAFNGKFRFYENTGNQVSFEFTLNELFYHDLDVGDNSTPFLIDYDEDNIIDMFSGNRTAKFFYFLNNGSNQNPLWQEVTDQFIDESFGNSTVPYFSDIDNDTDTDLFLGNVKGGLYLYENITVTHIENEIIEPPSTYHVTAHPNPFNPNVSITINLESRRRLKISIFNILGEKVKTMFNDDLNKGTHSLDWNGRNDSNQHLPSGSYIVVLQSGTSAEFLKLSLIK
jgi:hypothetical protein